MGRVGHRLNLGSSFRRRGTKGAHKVHSFMKKHLLTTHKRLVLGSSVGAQVLSSQGWHPAERSCCWEQLNIPPILSLECPLVTLLGPPSLP